MQNRILLISATTAATVALGVASLSAAVIGIEGFDYADGPIAGQTGGVGWTYIGTAEAGAEPQSPSNWNNVTEEPQVSNGALVTSGNSARREFGGLTEGSGAGSNEREGAIRGTGTVYFSMSFEADLLLAEGTNQWGGFSSYDFGAERVFFGVPGQSTAERFFGVAGGGITTTLSNTIPLEANRSYQLVGAVDFDADLVKLWVDPDGSDYDNGADTTADVTAAYTATNWSTSVRLGSGGGYSVTWDDLRVGDSFASAAVPEPATALLAALGLGAVAVGGRRRCTV